MTLTVKSIEGAKAKEKAYKLTDQNGLYLYIAPTGFKSWRANYVDGGKQKTRTYGRWPDLSLADARRKNLEAKGSAGSEQLQPASPNFEVVARSWLVQKLPSLSNGKHQVQVRNTLEKWVFPVVGSMPIDEIKRAQLVSIVQSVQQTGKLETAHRIAGRITEVFNFAQDTGLMESHPAASLTRALQARKTKKPMASLPPAEARQLFSQIATYDEPVTRLALMFAALTFVRSGELRGMRWSELREGGAIWVVPADRMKLRIPHAVPLSVQAQRILDEIKPITGQSELVFESPKVPGAALSENTLLFALYRLGYRGRMTVHGFRALASTVLNEESGFSRDVIERQLAHQETDDVHAAYNRAEYLPQRRELMRWWGCWIDQQCAAEGR